MYCDIRCKLFESHNSENKGRVGVAEKVTTRCTAVSVVAAECELLLNSFAVASAFNSLTRGKHIPWNGKPRIQAYIQMTSNDL